MKKRWNSFHLKLLTVLSLFIGRSCLLFFRKMTEDASTEPGRTELLLYYIGTLLSLAAVPVAGFLLVQAVRYTSSKKRLVIRLTAATVVAELLLDLAEYGIRVERYWWNGINLLGTLLLALFGILVMEEIVKKRFAPDSLRCQLFGALVLLLSAAAAVLLRTDQGASGVMIILAVYLFEHNIPILLIAIAALQTVFSTSMNLVVYAPVLGVALLTLYNGEQGPHGKGLRVLSYLGYPAGYAGIQLLLRLFAS